MKKIKTYPNHLEIITSVFIPYKDFDLEDFDPEGFDIGGGSGPYEEDKF